VTSHRTLQVIDIANPSSPIRTGSIITPGFGRRLAVDGSFVFVAGRAGLTIVPTQCATAR
jgi:hypothetical protein